MRDNLPYFVIALVILGIMVGTVAIKINNYHECRAKFSTLYCLTGGH